MPDGWVLLWHSWALACVDSTAVLGTCAPMASVCRGQCCFPEQRGERLMLPCMCHGCASAPGGMGHTRRARQRLGRAQHSGTALCQPFLWRGFILGLRGSEAASEICLQYYFSCLCVKSWKWLYLIKENGIALIKPSTSGVRLELLGNVCWPSCTRWINLG